MPTPQKEEPLLAHRLGITTHVSPLRMKVLRLMRDHPLSDSPLIEDWLLDLANLRGANAITRVRQDSLISDSPPSEESFTNEELVTAILQPHNRDRPQWLRAAAQLVSRGNLNISTLLFLAKKERVERILATIACQALRSDPDHQSWSSISKALKNTRPLRDTLIHWTRLAEPLMQPGKPNAQSWTLVA